MNRNGKIARLPEELREELNRRIDKGEQGPELIKWLNGLPQTRKVLQREFDGVPISKQNLSEWRNGGYHEWSIRQEMDDYGWQFHRQFEDSEGGSEHVTLASHLAAALSCRYAKFFATWDGEPSPKVEAQLRVLRGLNKDIALLHKTMTLAYDHKAQCRVDLDRASEHEIEEMKKKASDPLRALWREQALSAMMGNHPAAKKWAAQIAAIEYDLPLPEDKEEEAQSNPVKPEEPVQPASEKHAEQPEPEKVKPEPIRPSRIKSVKPVKPVQAVGTDAEIPSALVENSEQKNG